MASADTADRSGSPRVLLVGKEDCYLCVAARETIDVVCRDLGVEWRERSIREDPELADRYADLIPVVIVDDTLLDYFRVDEARLREALTS